MEVQQQQSSYIKPNLFFANSYDELKSRANRGVFERPPERWLEEIIEPRISFILGEPGQGKSRLLTEIVKILDKRGVQYAFLELRYKHQGESIEDFISRYYRRFKLDSEHGYVLLDGLDEVPQVNLPGTIEYLKTFIADHPNLNVLVSSRIHFFANYQHWLASIEALFVEVGHLTREQSKDLLASLEIDRPIIEKLFKDLNITYDRVSVLQTPRYLEMLARLVRDSPDVVRGLNRAMLFEAFVKGALKEEDTKQGRQLVLHKIRFLEKLALSMEIAQVNAITEDDLVTFIDDANSDVKTILLGQVGDIENLYEHSLLKKTGDEVSFTNAEIQEYLAARSLLRLRDPIRAVFDLTVEPNLRELIPTWRNTLSYIIDELPAVAVRLLEMGAESFKAQDESVHLLITGSTTPTMDSHDKERIFRELWSYYEDMRQMIPYNLSFNLANYASGEQTSGIVKSLIALPDSMEDRATAVNIINIAGDFAKLKKLNESEFIDARRRLIDIALNNPDPIFQHNAINSLSDFGDETIISELYSLKDIKEQLIQGSLQHLAYNLNKNSKLSIDIFAQGIKWNEVVYSRVGIDDVDDPDALEYFLGLITTDEDLVREIIDNNRVLVEEDDKFFDNLQANWRNDWIQLLKRFIIIAYSIDSGYYASRSKFVSRVIDIIANIDTTYIRELLTAASSDTHFLYSLESSIVRLVKLSDVKHLIDLAKKDDSHKHLYFYILWDVAHSDNPEASKIDKAAKKSFPDLYKQKKDALTLSQRKFNVDRQTLEFNGRVEKMVSSDESIAFTNMYKALEMLVRNMNDQSSHKTDIKYTKAQIATLWEAAKKYILDPFDPADTEVKINHSKGEGNRSFTITQFARLFETAIQFGYHTKQPELQKYRDKMISALPYAYYDDKKAILASLGVLSSDEKAAALIAYKNPHEDRALFMPENLVDLARDHNVVEAAPILNAFVDVDAMAEHIRIDALEVAEKLSPSKESLRSFFDKYKDSHMKIALKANAILVRKYRDKSSIDWLMQYIKGSAFEYTEVFGSGFHSVGDKEHEIHSKDKLKPLKGVDDLDFMDSFLDLLDFAFGLVDKGKSWHSYADYIFSAVDEYFSGVVSKLNHGVFTKLESHVAAYGDTKSTSLFIPHLNRIKNQYLEVLGRERPFAEAVHKMNELNSTQHLMISSEKQLHELVIGLIEKDLSLWVTSEGWKLMDIDEVAAQRNLSIVFENLFLKRGFKNEELRKNGIRLLRESQAEDDTRTDFLVYYGFFGPVVIELKQSSHRDLAGNNLDQKESYKSLEKYMRQFEAVYGVLFVYESKSRADLFWRKHLEKIRAAYSQIPGMVIVGIGASPKAKTRKEEKGEKTTYAKRTIR